MPTAAAIAAAVAAPPSDKTPLIKHLSALEAERTSRVLVYWTGPMAKVALGVTTPLFDVLRTMGKVTNLDLVLNTAGGDTEAPARVISLLREYCDRLTVLIPNIALSAGTLLSLGADEIVMTPLSVLGPIDPSRTHPLLPQRKDDDEPQPVSVQDMRHAMQFIRETTAGVDMNYSPEAWAEIFKALFDKIHPLAIGAIEQAYALSKLVGTRCLEHHMDPVTEADEIKRIVDTLCDDYKSHGYQIGRREAAAIGLRITDATPAEETILLDIMKVYAARPIFPNPPQQHPTKPVELETHLAWLDSTHVNFRAAGKAMLNPGGKIDLTGDQWVAY